MISSKAKYAIRALIYLAEQRDRGITRIEEIARNEFIPQRFLEVILAELKISGIVTSRRGRAGGYQLNRHPVEVSLAEIIRLMDGPLTPSACTSSEPGHRCFDCQGSRVCLIRESMLELHHSIQGILENSTLEKLLARRSKPPPVLHQPEYLI